MRALPRFQIPVNISLMKDDKTKTPDKPKLQVIKKDDLTIKQRQFVNKEEKLPLISTRDFLQVNTILCNSFKNIKIFGCSGQS